MTRRVSVWGGAFWLSRKVREQALDAARELEELGYSRLWTSGGFQDGFPSVYGELLAATTTLELASGIISIWHADPETTAAAVADLESRYPGRFLLGVGTSHAPVVDARENTSYTKPYSRMVEYLDGLDAASTPVPTDRRVLAALGPRMLKLSAERAAGAHPYFVPPEHTAAAREALGSEPLLAPEVAVVLETDETVARGLAHEYMRGYLSLPNYSNNLRRLGYTDEDLAGGGSDGLMDVLIPWGDLDSVVAGIEKHYAAGADEVAIQVLTADPFTFPGEEYRQLASALLG
ncbi:LLM class F420-dependent oxidoreductase [Rhodococcus rhodochrous]|uniref:LLM class F420-dependent oxidoreductase n=1 Tax=Rhodococcus rhodochrous TaxID=1829 RepID=A0AA46WVF9_RHORH|nr:LLM class F420-dependent oxidoreductase [Rhodococcus rhodochrous]MCB8911619.1 LLM class F420-dependent oxidoreductase [Rhodococcus rhodochrous]UZF45013.1 LLM class F420-dependent oxidoreductase [Rhodococcus rhodochrous]